MATYSDALTIGNARAQYFAENNFGDGGYSASWVKVQAGSIPIYFPNTAARIRAVRFHDLHHVATATIPRGRARQKSPGGKSPPAVRITTPPGNLTSKQWRSDWSSLREQSIVRSCVEDIQKIYIKKSLMTKYYHQQLVNYDGGCP